MKQYCELEYLTVELKQIVETFYIPYEGSKNFIEGMNCAFLVKEDGSRYYWSLGMFIHKHKE